MRNASETYKYHSSSSTSIQGRDFLPRGTGIVTRRPLVLQLINRPATSKPEVNGGEQSPSVPEIDQQMRASCFLTAFYTEIMWYATLSQWRWVDLEGSERTVQPE